MIVGEVGINSINKDNVNDALKMMQNPDTVKQQHVIQQQMAVDDRNRDRNEKSSKVKRRPVFFPAVK